MNLKELLAKCRGLHDDMGKALAAMGYAPDEAGKAAAKKLFEEKKAEFTALQARIEEAKLHAAYAKNISDLETLTAVDAPGVIPPPVSAERAGAAEARDDARDEREKEKVFEDYIRGKTLSDRGLEALRPRATNWTQAQGGVAVPKRLARLLLPSGAAQPQGKDLPLVSDENFGNQLAFPQYAREAQLYPGQAPALFPRTTRIPTKSGEVIWPKLTQGAPGAEGGAEEFAEYGYVACAWTAEGAEKPAAEPKFEQVSIKPYELAARTEISRILLSRSALDLESLMQTLFAGSILSKLDRAIVSGDGNGKPTGLLASGTAIGTVHRAETDQVCYDDLVDLETAVAPQFRANAAWAIHTSALQYVKKIKDKQDRPIFIQDVSSGMKPTILGYPVIPSQYLPDLGAEGDVIFGDWSQYVCAVGQEVVILRSEHRKIELGVIVYVAFVQVGGKVMQPRAFARLCAKAT